MAEETAAAPDDGKKAETTRALSELLGHMGVTAALDVKDAADGSISVALKVDGEFPGLGGGKRSHLLESMQFLINKIVNKQPNTRRWINLGVGEHPAPRQQKPPQSQAQPQQAAPASAPPKPAAAPPPQPKAQKPPQQRGGQNEASLEVEEDAALTAAVRDLAEKSARHGRYMAILAMTPEDRARTLKAAKEVSGVQVKLEGEGRNRRLSLHPDKPTPMPKWTLPDYDEEEEDEEQE